MKTLFAWLLFPFLVLGVSANSIAEDKTHVGQAIQRGGAASGNASASAAHSIAASGQVTSAVAAVPLAVGGKVLEVAGKGSTSAAKGSMKAATAPIGTPLKVTDESITVVPPNVALKSKDGAARR